jgi:pimeloyl-ACP methyl ester carboxylesterase
MTLDSTPSRRRSSRGHLHGGIALIAVLAAPPAESAAPEGWPREIEAIRYPCTADDSLQPALFFAPRGPEPAPLLVALHTWSGDHLQQLQVPFAEWAVERGWAFIAPEFRGPNRRPEATGSEAVVQDILDAVAEARRRSAVDARRVYLIGLSGGGYTALLMAGRHPELWAGVSAWVPIADLAAWYRECRALGSEHADDVAASCGGPPGASEGVDREYRQRSPLTWLDPGDQVPLDINAGIHDGHHSGGVPVSHALRAFNAVARESDRLSEAEIRHFVERQAVPPSLAEPLEDADYGDRRPLFRRSSGRARVTLFDGGHEIVYAAGLRWLERQRQPEPPGDAP